MWLFPQFHAGPKKNPHWQARLLFPHSSPGCLTPLQAEPDKIFLNPSRGFDGDPPRPRLLDMAPDINFEVASPNFTINVLQQSQKKFHLFLSEVFKPDLRSLIQQSEIFGAMARIEWSSSVLFSNICWRQNKVFLITKYNLPCIDLLNHLR
jgi:hypothetical protein